MSLASVDSLSKSYGAELILSGVSVRVERRDRIGLVGPNGAGKTTLLEMLAGRLAPDSGSISYAQGTRVGYLPQIAEFAPERTLFDDMLGVFAEVRAWEADMAALSERLADPAALADPTTYEAVLARFAEVQQRFEHADGYTIEQRVRQVLDGLGFSREQQAAPAASLSGGQQTRAALGRLLLQQPDLLLLDEPTNHLDLASIEWLEGYLLAWPGAVLVASHDRSFLDHVTTRTIEVANRRLTLYPGSYSHYLRQRTERRERQRKEFEAQQQYVARTEEFVRRYKAGQRSKEARGRQKMLDRLERVERPAEDEAISLPLRPHIESSQTVLTTEGLIAGYRRAPDGSLDGPALRVIMPDTLVQRGERIALIGPNGAGKTTLLRTLIGRLEPLAGRVILGHNVQIGYYAQTHEDLALDATVLDEILDTGGLTEAGARTYLARFLFSGDDVFKPVGAISGGERSRVALAKLTLQGANVLVLDEPTNHLDLPARQVLEEVLAAYPGTIVFVSHDRYFMDALATHLWLIENGAVRRFVGNYSAYQERRAVELTAPESEPAPGVVAEPTRPAPARARGRGRAPASALEQVESAIAVAEARLAELEAALAAAGAAADVARITTLGDEYDQTRAALERLYDDWQGLAV